MSANLDLVRSIYTAREQSGFFNSGWAHPEIEFAFADGPNPGSFSGVEQMVAAWRDFLGAWDEVRPHVEAYRELDDERVLVLVRYEGRGKASGLDLAQMQAKVAALFQLRDGAVVRLVVYFDRDRALADLGLEGYAMPEESTMPDPVELVRKQVEALNRRDFDGVMSSVAEDAVLYGRFGDFFEGRAAIRGLVEDWFSPWEELDFELEEVSDLGSGVVFAVVVQDGRPVGGEGRFRQREGWVYLWVGGSMARLTASEVDEACAAAERLAQERG